MKFGWTRVGLVKIEQEDGNRVQVTLPGRKTSRWISKTQLLPIPKSLRLCKKADFDQKCGCTPVVDIRGNIVEKYNVYGKMSKYEASGVKEGLDTTPHLRRKFLREKGFVRALGTKRPLKNLAQEIYSCLREGYRVIGAASPAKKAKKEAVVAPVAPAPAPVAPVASAPAQ